ncbi:hypothetical protein BGP79_01605 [Tersicoccus sp. Bi-70]|nr:hypothetical protein BGP79_01605 [Tersicoccus sp. Bi-70]
MTASSIIGSEIDDGGDDPDAVLAQVSSHGRTKQIELGNHRTPTVREVLSDAGDPPPADHEFVERCRLIADEHYQGMTGKALPVDTVSGDWDDDALNSTWE